MLKVPQILLLGQAIDQSKTLRNNTIVRKFKTKLISRIALRLLPANAKLTRRTGKYSYCVDIASHQHMTQVEL